ncbi:hypothetical protein AMECASPLE_024305 [Ameca splendens]|uniref:Uncharacterized protein n=1 Tax=Ameca splendens TaxID=208324 RepID=A0ABV0Y4G7_9TELE
MQFPKRAVCVFQSLLSQQDREECFQQLGAAVCGNTVRLGSKIGAGALLSAAPRKHQRSSEMTFQSQTCQCLCRFLCRTRAPSEARFTTWRCWSSDSKKDQNLRTEGSSDGFNVQMRKEEQTEYWEVSGSHSRGLI